MLINREAPSRLLRVREAAERLGVSTPTVWNLIRRGQLTPVHVGRSCRIAEADLASYVERLRLEARSKQFGSIDRRLAVLRQAHGLIDELAEALVRAVGEQDPKAGSSLGAPGETSAAIQGVRTGAEREAGDGDLQPPA